MALKEYIGLARLTEVLGYLKTYIDSHSGSGSGHTIITPDGTMTQRSNLNFTDAHGTDDSVDDETEITIFKHIIQADFNNLTPTQQNTGGYIIDDANPSYIPGNNCVSVTADGVKSHATLLDELLALADTSKIGRNTVLVYAPPNGNINYCHIDRDTTSNGISFSNTIIGLNNNNVVDYYFILKNGGCKYKERVNGSVTDNSTNAPTSGAKYILYYNIVATGVEPAEITANPSDIFTPESDFAIYDNTIQQIKVGRTVQLLFSIKKSDNRSITFNSSRTKLGTLASGWRPISYVMQPTCGSDTRNSYINQLVANLGINSNGDVFIDKASNVTAPTPKLEQIYITVCYIAEA